MHIGEFARRAGLSQDTVRFYVRKGLLAPQVGAKGGRNAWQVFSERDLSAARLIRFAQSLGMSLKEIAGVHAELERKAAPRRREIEILDAQLAKLEEKAARLAEVTRYLRTKRERIATGDDARASPATCSAST